MTCNPRVSVVIIFLNEEKFLRQAAEDRTGADPPVCRPFEHALGAVCGLGRGWLIPLLGVLAAYSCPRAWSATLLAKLGVSSFMYDISEQRPGSLALRGRAAG